MAKANALNLISIDENTKEIVFKAIEARIIGFTQLISIKDLAEINNK